MSDDRLEDYTIFLTLTVICSWGVQLAVVEFLFSQERSLFYDSFLIDRNESYEDMTYSWD